jgi:biopolymer transport protein ExbD
VYKPRKKKLLGQEAIPTTSLADMMFLLLIFFIMTTTLSRVTGFVTDMPSGSKEAQAQQPEKTTTVALHEDKIMVNDQDMSMAALQRYLQGLHLDQKTGDGKVVILSTTGDVRYQNYYETMAIIQSCGGVVAIVSEDGK